MECTKTFDLRRRTYVKIVLQYNVYTLLLRRFAKSFRREYNVPKTLTQFQNISENSENHFHLFTSDNLLCDVSA